MNKNRKCNAEFNNYSHINYSRPQNHFIFGTIAKHLYYYPVPSNLNYFWGLGSILGVLLVIQIFTGVLLAMYYTPEVSMAYDSVEFIMRNVHNG